MTTKQSGLLQKIYMAKFGIPAEKRLNVEGFTREKGIACPEPLAGCGTICVEVGSIIGYPSYVTSKINEEKGNRYRYTCPKCGKEWIYNTLFEAIFEATGGICIRLLNGKEVYEIDNPYILEHWGLDPERKYEFTAEEIEEIIKKRQKEASDG